MQSLYLGPIKLLLVVQLVGTRYMAADVWISSLNHRIEDLVKRGRLTSKGEWSNLSELMPVHNKIVSCISL
jgi:hypothetical protein